MIFVGWVSFKCLEIVVVVEEVMDFGRIVFSVYDDTCFTFITFGYHCIFLFQFAFYAFEIICLSFSYDVAVIVLYS